MILVSRRYGFPGVPGRVGCRNTEAAAGADPLPVGAVIGQGLARPLARDQDPPSGVAEFGPTNVAIHAVNIAVELGDAGQAIELGQQVTAASLSPERQARYWLDLAQAHNMRRQIGEALHALEEAERIAPEETRVHYAGRAVARDLLQLSGLRPRPELRDLAERFGVLP